MAINKNKGNFENSSAVPFLSIKTDGHRRKHHAKALLYVATLLKRGGSGKLNMHHAVDIDLDKSLPISLNHKYYDITVKGPDGLIILLEVKIIKGGKK